MRLKNGCQRGSPVYCGEPSRVAMGENVDDFARIFNCDLTDKSTSMITYRAIGFYILIADLLR